LRYGYGVLTTRPPASYDRTVLRRRYLENRVRSAELFAIPLREAYYDRPIGLRHPVVFYDGHIPAFSFNKLVSEALGGAPIDAEFQRLFERGIDPESIDAAQKHARDAWPSRERVERFSAACDRAVLGAFADVELDDPERSPLLERAQAAYTILEHEEMHHETFLYIVHSMPYDRKRRAGRLGAFVESAQPAYRRVEIPAGTATLGAPRERSPFGWDNEFGAIALDVPAFEIEAHDVTNGDWLAYVKAGGPVPHFWIERDGAFFLRGMFEEMPLPLSWPVYVTQRQASEYAASRGGRLPTEAEFHRAAFGTPSGEERAFPWGDALPDPARHGNFDLRRFDPEPVGSSPEGASAFGVHDLIGNGWEWTSTEFAPLPGFAPMASYPQYSADFFDGAHYVIKGASPVTNRNHIRRSFRNWYRADYPYVFATFRVAFD
jgi:formylglycine-generating enzyme required for sulfatase activity